MIMGTPLPYFCIHCGQDAPQVYKTYANGNLVKLLNCEGCGELIDKYVEYDNILIGINLILLNPMAYRHVLLNYAFESFWKLGVVTLFIEAYSFWCMKKGIESHDAQTTDFFELEINFYKVLLRTLCSTFLFQGLVLLSCSLLMKFGKERPLQFTYLAVWKGLCLSGFAEMFKLVALIWAYSQTKDHWRIFLVNCLFVLSNTQCYYVTTGVSQIKSFLVISFCFLLSRHVLQFYDEFVII